MIKELFGIIIQEIPYGDSSKIIHVLTSDYGVVGILCKGAKSMKSKNRATTLLYTYGTFYVYYHEDKLSILKEVDVKNSFPRIHSDIILISYLNYILELAKQVAKQSGDTSFAKEVFTVIEKIEEGLDPAVLVNILELKLLPFLGVGLSLDACVRCGSTKNIVTMDGDAGGYVCSHCYRNERLVSRKAVQLLRMYYYVDILSITELNISASVKKEINTFLDTYYERYTGLYLNSKKFLQKLFP